MRILFMGSPEFAVPSLRALVAAGHEVVRVVCQPDKPAGRGRAMQACAVKQVAVELGLAVATPERIRRPKGSAFLDEAKALAPDAIVVAAYGKILPRELLDVPRLPPLNVHASLLPRWRGASPIQHAILAGDDGSGVCIMRMVEALDAGGVFTAVPEPIAAADTAATLSARLASVGAHALVAALPRIASGELVEQSQDEAGVTLAPLLSKEDGRLDFSRSAVALARRVRAMNPWPGAFVLLAGAPFKVHAARAVDDAAGHGAGMPGSCAVVAGELWLRCGEGSLVLDEVQPAGRKRMAGRDHVRGLKPGALPTFG